MGVVRVRKDCLKGGWLHLEPVEEIRAKVRPLKQGDKKIAKIPALQPGPIMTIYEIDTRDAERLIKAARRAALACP